MTLHRHLPLLGFGLALTLIYTAAVFVAGAVPRAERPDVLAAALTVDLTLMVPLLYYVLLARPRGWPVVTVAPVFLLSLVAASLVVPGDHQGALRVVRYLAAPVEALLLGYLGLTVARTARRFQDRPASDDVLERLRTSLRDVLQYARAADVIAFEIALLYYALFSWRTRPEPSTKHIAFSYHQKSGYGSVVAGILVALLIEMIALHALPFLRNPAIAWGVTALSLYGLPWLLGDWRAVCLRPVRVEKDALIVRNGLRWTVHVPFAATASVLPATTGPPARKAGSHLNATLPGAPRYRVTLNTPVVAHGLYGVRQAITTLGFAPDDTEAFETELKRRSADGQQGRPRIDQP